MEYALRTLDSALLPAFRPYLMPQAAQALEAVDEAIIAMGAITADGHTCAAVAAERTEDGAVLTSLYVDPQVRRRGVGTLLLEGLKDTLLPTAILEAEWVLPMEAYGEMAAFLGSQGFRCDDPDEPVYRLESADLQHTPLLRRAFSPTFRPDRNIVPYGSLTPLQRRELLEDPEIPHWLRPDAVPPEALLDEMSLCYLYSGRVTAYLLLSESGSGECAIRTSYTREGAHPAAFLQLATAALSAGLRHFGGSFVCWLDAGDPRTEALARQLTGDRLEPWWTGYATNEI